jgi:hypothetical protein
MPITAIVLSNFWDMACSLSLVAPSQASYCWWGRSTAGPSH